MNKFVTAGIDIGSVTTKVVILKDEKIISKGLSPTGTNPKLTVEKVLDRALEEVNLSREDLEYIVSTGYGRRCIEFGNKTVTEISCCAKGARWSGILQGTVRTIIDLGGQDVKVISLDEDGTISDFVMNDKCAAGTGRFLEVMAACLGVNLEELGDISQKAHSPIKINSTCAVFAESEVISLIAQGKNKEDIIAGLHHSIAERIVPMVKQMKAKEIILFVGGGAKNKGIHQALEDKLGVKVYVPDEPQFVIALGAALIAKEAIV